MTTAYDLVKSTLEGKTFEYSVTKEKIRIDKVLLPAIDENDVTIHASRIKDNKKVTLYMSELEKLSLIK